MLRYAITDRQMFAGDEGAQLEGLIRQARRLAEAGVDVLQVREKDLSAAALGALLARLRAEAPRGSTLKLLVNAAVGGAVAVELAVGLLAEAGADGIHLPGGWSAETVAAMGAREGAGRRLVVSVACHKVAEVGAAAEAGVDLILFGPVFGKQVGSREVVAGTGLEHLREAVAAAAGTPVLALGGVTEANATACVDAGAAGVAGIRMFAGL